MNTTKKFTWFYPATLNYLLFIVLLNTLFSYVPNFNLFGHSISIADFVVGFIYVMRDFAQRETKHWVILAMLIGCLISWMLAEHQAALASVGAFAVGETLDWGIYTYTKKPLSQRILFSSVISSPIDSAVNLFLLYQLNWVGFIVMTLTKFAGVIVLWAYWRVRRYRNNPELQASV
jgi:queuosine precursor transporter